MAVELIYKSKYSGKPVVVRAPGRINLIGEHTDYNGGFVLPCAIDKYVYVAAGRNEEERIRLYALQFGDYECELEKLKPLESCSWQNYVLGVVAQLQMRGHNIGGFNAVIDGDIPIGAGLSSWAAMECAIAYALNVLFELNLSKMDIVDIAQAAEHNFAGVQCGVMDQFASVFSKKNQLIRLDCRSMEHEHVSLMLAGYKILLLNTNVKHNLASSAYNQRRAECEQGLKWVQELYPEVESLRDVTSKMLYDAVFTRDMTVFRRCSYVIEENDRLLKGCEDLAAGRLEDFGKKMFATHRGLRDYYEVSCEELDYLVYAVSDHPAVLGARMMGGGFGGCTINIVKEDAVEELIESLSERYMKDMRKKLTAYVAETANGVEEYEDRK